MQQGPLSASHHFASLIVPVSVSFYIFSLKKKVQRKWGRPAAHKHMALFLLLLLFFHIRLPITANVTTGKEGKKSSSEVILQTWNFSGPLSPCFYAELRNFINGKPAEGWKGVHLPKALWTLMLKKRGRWLGLVVDTHTPGICVMYSISFGAECRQKYTFICNVNLR